ncbi:MAG: MltA domain-containing protein [Magnetococcales bacterium]|nr:MltA domain-containing protein [Magnetococcales bacterium]
MDPVPWSEVQEVFAGDTNLKNWASALEQSAIYYGKLPATTTFTFGNEHVDAKTMRQAVNKLAHAVRTLNPKELEILLTSSYRLYQSPGSDRAGNVLVTAYYEPLLHGSLKRSKKYRFPLYKRPPDLEEVNVADWRSDPKGKRVIGRKVKGKMVPYYDRADIDRHKRLEKRGLELVWVDNELDAFFLQVQGSGRVLLDNGQTMRVGYHCTNGHPYRSIGKLLIEEKQISKEDMSLPSLRTWLQQHPDQITRVFEYNPSYVFFRKMSGEPQGNTAVPLTPGRSVATDHRLFPKGAPGLLKTSLPILAADKKTVTGWRKEIRFVVNQDTGGAIAGPGRVDLFTGFGDEAESIAGIMKSEGSSLYFIAPIP